MHSQVCLKFATNLSGWEVSFNPRIVHLSKSTSRDSLILNVNIALYYCGGCSQAATSECLQRSLEATAEEQQLHGHSEQEAAWCAVFVPEQAFEFRVAYLWCNEHLHDFATLH